MFASFNVINKDHIESQWLMPMKIIPGKQRTSLLPVSIKYVILWITCGIEHPNVSITLMLVLTPKKNIVNLMLCLISQLCSMDL